MKKKKGKTKKEKNKVKLNYKIERVSVNAVVYSTEDPEKVGEAISTLFPFEFEIAVSKAKGHYGNELLFLEVDITGNKKIKEFLKYFFNLLGDALKTILDTLEERIDEDNTLHIRIDKQKAYLGEVALNSGDSGDSIAIKIKIVTYPSKKEYAIKAFKEFLKSINLNITI